MKLLERFRNGHDQPEADHRDELDLSADEIFNVLSVERRRHVIAILAGLDPGDEISLGELARNLAFIENGHERMTEVGSAERKRVYIVLYQSHLDVLHDAGIVEWDERSKIVRRTPLTDGVAAAMTHVEGLLADVDTPDYPALEAVADV